MSKPRHGIMQLHRPVKLKLERWRVALWGNEAFINEDYPLSSFDAVTEDFYLSGGEDMDPGGSRISSSKDGFNRNMQIRICVWRCYVHVLRWKAPVYWLTGGKQTSYAIVWEFKNGGFFMTLLANYKPGGKLPWYFANSNPVYGAGDGIQEDFHQKVWGFAVISPCS